LSLTSSAELGTLDRWIVDDGTQKRVRSALKSHAETGTLWRKYAEKKERGPESPRSLCVA